MGDDTSASVAIAGLASLIGVGAIAYATYLLVLHRARAVAAAAAEERAWASEVQELLAEFLSLGALLAVSMDRARSDAFAAERDTLNQEVWPRIYRFVDVRDRLEGLVDLGTPTHRALIETLRRAFAEATEGEESFAAAREELTRCAQELFEAVSGESGDAS